MVNDKFAIDAMYYHEIHELAIAFIELNKDQHKQKIPDKIVNIRGGDVTSPTSLHGKLAYQELENFLLMEKYDFSL